MSVVVDILDALHLDVRCPNCKFEINAICVIDQLLE